tara:strand:+ start:356 stop:1087 length:732 start_codon:yes stop_codon:yes gene_type:complete
MKTKHNKNYKKKINYTRKNIKKKIVVLDSGGGGKSLVRTIKSTNKNVNPIFHAIYGGKPVGNLTKKDIMNKMTNILDKNYNNKHIIVIIACHSASSSVMDKLIENNFFWGKYKVFEPIMPMCIKIKEKNYKNIIILSTKITQKTKWHARILNDYGINNVHYITLPLLAGVIDRGENINTALEPLHHHNDIIKKADCVVLGCTHYNMVKEQIYSRLKKHFFKGYILNSNKTMLKYIYDYYSSPF